jgi:Phosphatidylglycerol lysyltransferase, C-terminal
VDSKNLVHSKGTYWIIRGEHLAVLALCSTLAIWNAGAVNWWRALAAFWIIDLVGYLPGAFAFIKNRGRPINPWYHHVYNFCHTYLVTGTGVAVWAYVIGGFEWAMLAVPIHLAVDRGIFGNILKPVGLSFEPRDHSEQTVLQAIGHLGDPDGDVVGRAGPENVESRVSRNVMTEVLGHPSGYLALTGRNEVFVSRGIPGFVAYRKQGKHLWMFGGVHAKSQYAGELLDRFLKFAAREGLRPAAIQVRQDQVDLFADRGFTVNQLGSTFAVSLAEFSMAGGPKMQLRNKIKRARNLGLKVVEIGKDVPRDAVWFEKLAEISARWLAAKGKKELDFMVGEVGGPDDNDRRIFLVLNGEEKPVAFISYVPVWGNERPGYLHDLTRRIPNVPPGAMELCNAEAIERFRAEGVKYLHFGFTPFIVDDKAGHTANRLLHRTIGWLRRFGQKLYPADSQMAYKTKWGTDVVEREYVAARRISPRTVLNLLFLTRSI